MSRTTAEERHRRLVEFVRGRAGARLRAALYYTADDCEVLALREDLSREAVRDVLPRLHDSLADSRGLVEASEYEPLGPVEATVELHEEGLLVHIVEGERRGTLLSLEREAGADLTEFVEACSRRLAE
jgi:hypothetical protein